MDPVELRARRVALGLSQLELAEMLACTQSTISRWEGGFASPRDPASVDSVLQEAEGLADELIGRLEKGAEHASGILDSPFMRIRTYRTDAELWARDAWCEERGVRASMHRVAAARAARLVRDDGIVARLTGVDCRGSQAY